MEILPAIDILAGHAVRLRQGDYGQITTFPGSILATGRRWQAEGARWLHVVDLDGARDGQPRNTALILELRQTLMLRIEVGGGLRTAHDVAALLDAGIDRVVLGTAAMGDLALLENVLARGADRLVVALDARAGLIATGGWLTGTGRRVEEVARLLAGHGVRWFSHTDIARDGVLAGPNFEALGSVQAALTSADAPAGAIRLIAAGGISTLADIRALRRQGVAGAILGRAIYAGDLALPEAIRVATEEEETASA